MRRTLLAIIMSALAAGGMSPAFGYVLEGEYEWAIDGNPARTFKAGDTFYEPTGCLHDVGRNPSKMNKARFIAIVLHPEDAKDVVIPEMKK